MNRNTEGKLCGDCNSAVYEKAAAYTPVPGGIGPMTRAILMYNTALAAGLEVFKYTVVANKINATYFVNETELS